MKNTLRLLMPQWQGGNNPVYSLGAQLLSWLAPASSHDTQIEVPIKPYDGTELPMEGQVVGRSVLLKQLADATQIIVDHQLDRIITFGGDCLITQAPFAYLNQKYNGRLGVLWIDAHPDVSTPDMHNHEHAMVLGNLLGQGDPQFSSQVERPLDPKLIMYAGLQKMTPQEAEIVKTFNFPNATVEELSHSSDSVLQWIKENKIEHLAIHLDLDVLDPRFFRSQLLANLDGTDIDTPSGQMTLQQVGTLIQDVSQFSSLVGFSVAEHLPWDALNLKNFLESLPIFQDN